MFATLQHIPIAQITGISEKYYAIAKQSEEIWKCQPLSVGVYFSKYENTVKPLTSGPLVAGHPV